MLAPRLTRVLRRPAPVSLALLATAALLVTTLTAGAARKAPKRGPDPLAQDQYALDAIQGRGPLRRFRRDPAAVPLAVIDTGVALGHRDLRAALWTDPHDGTHGWDPIGTAAPPKQQPDALPQDENGHGTLVASIAAASTDNTIGIAGVAPNAKLMAIRSCWTPGDCYDATTAASIGWAAAHGARVVNLSIHAQQGWSLIAEAIKAHPGVLFVAPAGNAGANLDLIGFDFYPCEIPLTNLICVAASGRGSGLASCSNYGPSAVDLAAPGEGLIAAAVNGGYAREIMCGTSLAAPHVSGLGALLFGAVPEANALQVRAAILDAVTPDPALAGKVGTGGIVSVGRSLALLQDRFGIPRPPATRIGEARIRDDSATFELRSRRAKARSFECSLDEGPFRRCPRRAHFDRLKRGPHILAARARGVLQTVDPTPAKRRFRIG